MKTLVICSEWEMNKYLLVIAGLEHASFQQHPQTFLSHTKRTPPNASPQHHRSPDFALSRRRKKRIFLPQVFSNIRLSKSRDTRRIQPPRLGRRASRNAKSLSHHLKSAKALEQHHRPHRRPF